MKKHHLMLLIITAITAFSSAYSLAAMNQVYKISFDWFSEYNNSYISVDREMERDKWHLEELPSILEINTAANLEDLKDYDFFGSSIKKETLNLDFSKYIYISCFMGKLKSPEYRIKVKDIAQRGDIVEIVVSLNSPLKADINTNTKTDVNTNINVGTINTSDIIYQPWDFIRIDRNSFPVKGKILFIFKTQDGAQISDQYFII